MSIEVKLPKLGEGVDSGDVLEILVQVGDLIKKDQDIVELETDKATVGVPSSHAGKVLEVLVSPGDTVSVGAGLITLEATVAADATRASAPPAERLAEPPAATAHAPKSPTPPTANVPPAMEPPFTEPSFTEPPLAEPPLAEPPSPAPAAQAPPTAGPSARSGGPLPAGPAIRRFAREVGVDLTTVTGSGAGGRITREDVLEFVRQASLAAKTTTPGSSTGHPAEDLPGTPSHDAWGAISLEKTSKVRKTIAAKMFESWSTAPRVTNFDDADITELEKIRQKSKAEYAAAGIKLTSMPFLIKAVSTALRKHALLNSSLDEEHDQIIYKQYVNVGIAVDTDRGLVVPTLRNTDQKSISEIARDLAQLAENARNNSFSLEDLRGGTFTISNLGAVGGSYSTPIINVPEVAILLAGRSRKMPVIVEDAVVARLMMPLSLSYDHRLVDGATAARFLNEVIGFLQAPSRLLMAL